MKPRVSKARAKKVKKRAKAAEKAGPGAIADPLLKKSSLGAAIGLAMWLTALLLLDVGENRQFPVDAPSTGNLLANALKYVPAGGTIRVALSDGPVLVVADDGPGIAEADRTRIFERFQRGPDVKAGEERPGAGLGLALASAIAQRHSMSLECLPSATGALFQLRRERP